MDLSHGRWAVNLSEIIYEPNFWANIRKPYTYFDVAISNFPFMDLIKHYIVFRDIYVVVTKPITNLDNPLYFRATIKLLREKPSVNLDDEPEHSFDVVKENGYDIRKKPIQWVNDLQSKQKYHASYGYLLFRRQDIIFIYMHAHLMQMFDKVRLKIITKSLYVKYYEDMGKYPDPAVQHVDFDDHNYPKAENFVTKLNGMINKTIHNIMVEKMAYPSVLYSSDGEFKYLKILMKKEKCSIIKTEHSIKIEFDIRFMINKTLQYVLGFTKYPHVEYGEFIVTETEIIGTHDVDLNRAPPASLWVFSDIVKQSYVNMLHNHYYDALP